MDMILDGGFADLETARYFPVGQTRSDQSEDLVFAVSQFSKHVFLCHSDVHPFAKKKSDDMENLTSEYSYEYRT